MELPKVKQIGLLYLGRGRYLVELPPWVKDTDIDVICRVARGVEAIESCQRVGQFPEFLAQGSTFLRIVTCRVPMSRRRAVTDRVCSLIGGRTIQAYQRIFGPEMTSRPALEPV